MVPKRAFAILAFMTFVAAGPAVRESEAVKLPDPYFAGVPSNGGDPKT